MLTQHIMQQVTFPAASMFVKPTTRSFTQALIKRKLEEQKENFRRRQGDEVGPIHSQPPSTQAEALGQPPLAKVTLTLPWDFKLCNNDLSRRFPKQQWPTLPPSPSRPPL